MKIKTIVIFNIIWIIFIFVLNYFFIQPQNVRANNSIQRTELFKDFFTQYESSNNSINPPNYFYSKKINVFNPYFPTVAFFYKPFTIFSYKTAALIFFCVNITFFLYTVNIIRNRFNINNFFIFFLFLYFPPAISTIVLGNNNIIILFLLTILSLKNNKIIYKSIFLSIAILLKLYSLFLLLYYSVSQQYKLIYYVIVSIIVIIIISIFFIPFENYTVYFEQIFPNYNKAWIIKTIDNQSILSLMHKLFGNTFDQTTPLTYYPKIIFPVTYFLSFTILIITYLFSMKNKNHLLNFNFYIITIILIFSVTWHHTFTLLLLPIAYGYYFIKKFNLNRYYHFFYYLSFFLISINYDTVRFQNKIELLLTSPNLYGTFILYFLYIKFIRTMKK